MIFSVGDLVRVPVDWSSPLFGREGTVGIIMEIEEYCDIREPKTHWAILHTGEKFELSDLELVNGSR